MQIDIAEGDVSMFLDCVAIRISEFSESCLLWTLVRKFHIYYIVLD